MMPAARGPRFGFVIARAGSHIHFRRNRHRVSAAGLDLLIERTSAQLRQISGVADAGIKPGVVASRVAAELLARGEPSLSQLLDSAEGGDATAKTELRNLLTVNYSCFWREPEHWPILAEHLCLRIQSGAPLRMWSAACARGEEAWTMALVATEVATRFPTLTPHWDWQVLGTDIDTPSLEAARIARYTQEELGPLPLRMRSHLLPSGSDTAPRWDIPAGLHAHVHFRHLDLAQAQWQPPAEAPFDAIFLSNVLIYLDRAMQERILRNVAACLRPDGILFTSRIEGNLGLASTHLKAAGSCTYITARTARRP